MSEQGTLNVAPIVIIKAYVMLINKLHVDRQKTYALKGKLKLGSYNGYIIKLRS